MPKRTALWLIFSLLVMNLSSCAHLGTTEPESPVASDRAVAPAASDRATAPAASDRATAPAAPPLSVTLTADMCLANTRTAAECKDCCDSLATTGDTRKTCRNACPQHDFTGNTDFITLDAPSVLGPTGDYAACTSLAGEQACKACCDGSADLQSGDRRFCRDACARSAAAPITQTAEIPPPVTPNQAPRPKGQPSPERPPQQGQVSAGLVPPTAAIVACSGRSAQAACEFTSQKGAETGICEMVQNQLACSPQRGFANGAQPDQPGNQPVGPNAEPGSTAYNVEQAISDKAQGMTIALDALAFLTGDLGSDSFFPPGKVADFWGFQYLRDNDPSQMGHAGDFLTSASMNVLHILTSDQRASLVALAESQVDTIGEYGYKRFVLMKAFRRLLEGDLPAGTTGLSEDAVKAYSAELYRLDGEISFARAQQMGRIITSLDVTQRAYLDAMIGKGMLEWPDVAEPSDLQGLDRSVKEAVMTYAADMFSWYAGSIDADVYFCPERHGTYFGSFYLKDIPAMGNPGYAIPTDLTGNMGDAMLAALTPDQAQVISGLVDIQKPYLLGIVETREQVSTELRKFMAGHAADRAAVLSLMERYGELDGEIVYNLAANFAQVYRTLTVEQKAQLMALRNEMLGDLTASTGAYLYSQPISMPEIQNTDFLFK